MKYISIGVDPGSSSGAIAVIKDGILHIHGIKGKTEQQIERVFYETLLDKGFQTEMFGVIEKVAAMKGQGVSSTFKFGMNYGFLRCCLVSNRIPFRDMIPKVWQKEFSMVRKKSKPTEKDGAKIPGVSEPEKQWKERLLNVAQNLYPQTPIPLYAGDAVLLAHIARNIINSK